MDFGILTSTMPTLALLNTVMLLRLDESIFLCVALLVQQAQAN
jgi:hypothetical protein